MAAFLRSFPVICLLLCFIIFKSSLVLNEDNGLLLLLEGVANDILLFHAQVVAELKITDL